MSIITRTCLKQGVLYFLAISAVNLLNVVSFIQPYKPFAGINTPFSLGLPSLLACRMFLGLRKVGRHEGVSAAETSADVSFARRPATHSGPDEDWAPSLTLPWSVFGRDTRSHDGTAPGQSIQLYDVSKASPENTRVA